MCGKHRQVFTSRCILLDIEFLSEATEARAYDLERVM